MNIEWLPYWAFLLFPLVVFAGGNDSEGVSSTSSDTRTPQERLIDAVRDSDVEAARAAMAEGADIHARSRSGSTALHIAVLNENEAFVAFLLECGVAVNLLDDEGATPLYIAFLNDQPEIMGMLVRAGARVVPEGDLLPDGQRDEHGHTQLLFNAAIAAGITFDPDLDGGLVTALHLALLFAQPDMYGLMMVQHFAQLREHLDMPLAGLSPRKGIWDTFTQAAQVHLAEMYHRNEAKAVADDGYTPLALAVLRGMPNFVTLLVFAGADLFQESAGGYTAQALAEVLGDEWVVAFIDEQLNSLHRASATGDVERVEVLAFQQESAMNVYNHDGLTPLQLAIIGNHLPVVKLLIRMGASLARKDMQGRTVFELASAAADPGIFAYLNQRVFALSVDSGDLVSLRVTVMHGAQVHEKVDYDGLCVYPICRAAYLGHANVVRYLINSSVDVNLSDVSGEEQPLSVALAGWVQSGADGCIYEDEAGGVQFIEYERCDRYPKRYHEVLMALIRAGATITYDHMKTVMERFDDPRAFQLLQAMIIRAPLGVNIPPSGSMQPRMPLLCVAMLQEEHAETLTRLLLGWGARIELAEGYDGYQPIHIAAAVGNRELVRSLIGHGVSVNRVGPQGVTALTLAARHGNFEIVRLLLRHGADVAEYAEVPPLHAVVWGAYEAGLGINVRGLQQFVEVAGVLIDRGASCDVRDTEGRTPLELAQVIDRKGVIDERLIDILRGVEWPEIDDGMVVEVAVDMGGPVGLIARENEAVAIPSGAGVDSTS